MGGAWAQTKPSSGNGEVDSPYIITTAEELKWFRDEVNRGRNNICAKIADNVEVIDMSTVCHAADKSQNLEEVSWEPIGNTTNKYMGTFDGNNKTITNLYINANQEYSGLFGYTYISTIKNLTFVNANVTNTNSFTGILVGYGNEGTYQNIMTSTSCEVNGGDGTGGIAGKLAGNAYNCVNYATVQGKELVGGLFSSYDSSKSITACANYGKVTASSQWVGGLVGYFNSGTIQDCANYGDVKGTNHVAGLAGYVSSGKIQNVFSYGNVSATNSTQYIGMAFGFSNSGATEGMVAYYSGAKLTANGQEKDVKAFGSGTPSEDNATGFTEAQLKSGVVAYLLQQNASSEAKWGQNLANDGDIYPVIGSEHTVYADNSLVNCKTHEKISGSFTNNPSSSAIRYKHGATIHHAAANATCTEAATKEYWQCQDCQRIYSDSQLTVKLTDVTDAEHPALGHNYNEDGYCDRCKHYVAVKPSEENGVYLIAKPYHLAWFRDYVNGTIVNEGEVAGTTHPSASAMLTADIDLKNYCHAAEDGKELLSWIPIGNYYNRWKGNMNGQGHTISNLYIKTAQNYVGLFGSTERATIQDLIFDYAKVENVNTTNTNTLYTGILAGYADGVSPSHIRGIKTTNNCTVIGQEDTGGIVGGARINLENCENHSSVKGTSELGGIAGSSTNINIKCCTNYGTVENNNSYIGGIIGYAWYTSIEDCANYGKITSTGWKAGGIAGQTFGKSRIQNVFSYGDVTNTNDNPGIIIGYVRGTLTAKGIVAYNKEALLNNSSENIKIVGKGSLTFEDGKEEADVVKAFTKQQIESGEVAYLLAEGKVLGEQVWGQQLGKDQYPVPGSDNKVIKAAQGDKDANGNDTYWATFSNPTNDVTLSVPSDRTLKVYNATVSGGKMTLAQRNDYQVAKEEGVLLKTDGEYVNAKANETNELATAFSDENHLVATPAEAKTVTAETGCKLYRLTYNKAEKKEGLGFYLGVDDGTSLKATPGKAYLQVYEDDAKDPSSAALARSFVFGGGNETTGIEGITIMGTDVQRHGTIEGIFDLQGRKIVNPTKGIYIKNNKKVIIK
ncbi:GLUG motif-containing protein [Segatella sp.]|uniref:GLUG motif-containing protein n=1 Tax=Segatella sp. TaxID=2974253 RepID=UPI003AB95A62